MRDDETRPMREAAMVKDIYERTRRIETRVTRFLASAGFETGGRQPVYLEAIDTIEVPNAAVSLVDCLAALPDSVGQDDCIPVIHNGAVLGYISRP